MLNSRDTVVATSEDEVDRIFDLDGQPWIIKAKGSTMVPFDLLRIHFGDPRSGPSVRKELINNETVWINDRASEMGRLATCYGLPSRVMEAVKTGTRPPTLAEVAPKITFTDAAGDPIATVVDDPIGVPITATLIDLSSTEAINARLDTLSQEVMALRQARAELAETDGQEVSEVPEDGPGPTGA